MRSALPFAVLALLGCGASLNESIADASARFRRAAGRPACADAVDIRRVQDADQMLFPPPFGHSDEELRQLAGAGQLYTVRCEGESCYGLVVTCLDGPESCEAIGDNWMFVGDCGDPLRY